MSVLIKGMKMPENCRECPVALCGKYCRINKTHTTFIELPIRPDHCPLVEIPDKHGDLIDRDKVIPKLKFINEAEHQIYGRASWGFTAKCINVFDDALPVIEAEDSE